MFRSSDPSNALSSERSFFKYMHNSLLKTMENLAPKLTTIVASQRSAINVHLVKYAVNIFDNVLYKVKRYTKKKSSEHSMKNFEQNRQNLSLNPQIEKSVPIGKLPRKSADLTGLDMFGSRKQVNLLIAFDARPLGRIQGVHRDRPPPPPAE